MNAKPLPFDRTQLKALLFDVDGTLYRQTPVRAAMLWKLGRAHLFRPIEGFRTMRVLGAYRKAHESLRNATPADDLGAVQLKLACAQTGVRPATAAAYVDRWMEREPLPLLARSVHTGAMGFLSAARDHGLRLGVFSDYPAERKLEAMGIDGLFDVVVSAQDPAVGALKPSPRGLEVVMERLGVAKHEALYVGDRPDVDAVAASGAGVACVIVGWTGPASGGDWIPMRDYMELRNAIF